MYFFFYIILFLIGTSIGSFLNVVALRFNTGRSLSGRSGCFSCHMELGPRDLIPILGFFLNRGRCRGCGSGISIQYPIVELLTGVFVVILAWKANIVGWSLVETVTYGLAVFTLIVIGVYDIRHKIIPDPLVYLFGLLGLFVLLGTPSSVLDYAAGPIFFSFFGLLWLASGGARMGFGDAKLVLGMGLLLGFYPGLAALAFAFWSGAIVGVCALFARGHSFSLKSEIPFAPFLIFGTIIALLFQNEIVGFFLSYSAL